MTHFFRLLISPNVGYQTIMYVGSDTRPGRNFVVRTGLKSRIFFGRLKRTFAYLAVALSALCAANSASADNPFNLLAGTWNGSGAAKFEGGKTESLRCKGYYTNGAGGTNLGLSIRCANASAKVELRANLTYANGTVTGSWEERTYNQSGTVSGKASSNKMNLNISGGIQGSMSVAMGGGGHQVSVSTGGPTLKGINISMSR